MKLMFASDIHGSALYCEKMLEAYSREGAERLCLPCKDPQRHEAAGRSHCITVGGQEPPAYIRVISGSRQVADIANSVYV